MTLRLKHAALRWVAVGLVGVGAAFNAGAQNQPPTEFPPYETPPTEPESPAFSNPVINHFMQACYESSASDMPPPAGCDALYGLIFPETPDDGSALNEALRQIEPNQVPTLSSSTFLQQGQMTSVQSRLTAVHGGGGRGVSVLDMPLYNGVTDGRHRATATGSAGDDKAFADTPWGFFISGNYQDGDVNRMGEQDGFDYSSRSVTAGFDYRIGNSLVLGASLARGNTENKVKNRRGKVDMDNWSAWFYGSYFPDDHFYLDWSLGYGKNDYDGKRHIDFESNGEPFSATLDYDTDGRQYNASVSTGYDANYGAWQYGTYLGLDWMKATIDGYHERGGSVFALALDDQNAISLLSSLGGRLGYPISFSKGVVIPGVDVAFVHQWRDEARRINASFVALPEAGGFSITSRALDKSYFNIAMSLTGVFTGGQSAYLRFQTVAARSDVTERIIEAGYRLEF